MSLYCEQCGNEATVILAHQVRDLLGALGGERRITELTAICKSCDLTLPYSRVTLWTKEEQDSIKKFIKETS